MKMRAVRVAANGGPEVLAVVELERPRPGLGEALVRLAAMGVNYIDVYHRTGLYPIPLPFTPGLEGAGVVAAIGPAVADLAVGDRVAWAMAPGAYAEFAVVPAAKLVRVPEAIDLRTAAAAMLQGMTAHYLVTDTYRLGPGKTALVHAAAGGVGALAVQLAKRSGARVFGTASTAKLEVVRAAGADEAIDYTAIDFKDEVMRLTGGRGVDVVYDSVGRTTFDRSLESVALRGTLVSFGQSSGPVPPLEPLRLAKNGIYLTRPSLAHYTATRDELLGRARDLFAALAAGELHVRIDRELPLVAAAEAHRLLESRATAGKILLIP
jgi:NADPH:quinone reductase